MTSHALEQRLASEIQRSAKEAQRLAHADLSMPDIARYDNPSLQTCWPLEYAYALLPDIKGKHVLDYGCGDGLNTVGLLRRGAHVSALDLSPELLHVAMNRVARNCDAEQITRTFWHSANAEHSGFVEGWFDVVFGTAILHHLNLDRAMAEVYRLLAPGGVAIFKEPLRNSALVRSLRALVPYKHPEVSPDERPLTHTELMAAITKAGFQQHTYKDFLLPTTNLIEAVPFLRRFARYSYRLDAFLLAHLPFLRYYASQRVFTVTKPAHV